MCSMPTKCLPTPLRLSARHSRLLGVHLNDGYGKRDDGLMVGSVHPLQTIELLYVLERIGYDGAHLFRHVS